MRTEIMQINNELNNLSELNIEISELLDCVNQFSNRCILKNNTTLNVLKLAEAKACVITGINILKGIVKSKDNRLIYEFENRNINLLEELDKYFENFISMIDASQKQLTKDIKDAKNEVLAEIILPATTKYFMEELKSVMNNVIIYPISLATKVYTELHLDERRTKYPIKEFFEYILFIQILNASKIAGSEKRQKGAMASGSQNATFQEIQNVKMGRPKQVQEKKVETKEDTQNEMDDFDDMFYEDEV